MPWIQTYTPAAGSLGWSALLAAVPLVVIFLCLAVVKMKAHKAALLAVGSALAIAVGVWGMPVKLAGLAFGQGARLWSLSRVLHRAHHPFSLQHHR